MCSWLLQANAHLQIVNTGKIFKSTPLNSLQSTVCYGPVTNSIGSLGEDKTFNQVQRLLMWTNGKVFFADSDSSGPKFKASFHWI